MNGKITSILLDTSNWKIPPPLTFVILFLRSCVGDFQHSLCPFVWDVRWWQINSHLKPAVSIGIQFSIALNIFEPHQMSLPHFKIENKSDIYIKQSLPPFYLKSQNKATMKITNWTIFGIITYADGFFIAQKIWLFTDSVNTQRYDYHDKYHS